MTSPNTSATTTPVTSIDPTDIITTQTDPAINIVCPQYDRACPATDFYTSTSSPNGRHRLCADCEAANAKFVYTVNPRARDRIRANTRRTRSRYQAMTENHDTVNGDRDWTDAETDHLIDNYRFALVVDIARDLGRSYDSVNAKARYMGLRKTVSRPAHRDSAHITGVGAAIHHDNRPWTTADDIYLYRHFRSRSLTDWSVYLERSEDMIRSRYRHLCRPGNAPV